MGSRKIIQITTESNNLYALCDDHTIWVLLDTGIWFKLPDIPQERE